MKRLINKKIYQSIFVLVTPLVVIFSVYFYSLNQNIQSNSNNEINYEVAFIEESIPRRVNFFDGLNLTANSVIVKNLNTGKILYEKNSEISAPLASVTKLMTALVLYENFENLDKEVVVTDEVFTVHGNTSIRFGEIFTLQDLITMMLINSSNQSAVAASRFFETVYGLETFIPEMNSLARSIGMNNTYFLNETGLDENINTAGSFGSARDIVLLLEYIIKNYPEMAEITTKDHIRLHSKTGFIHDIRNTNHVISNLPTLLLSKTGFTELAGGNLVIIKDVGLNNPIAIVVLGSSREGRFNDTLSLLEAINKNNQ